ncbi:MAG: hypothetical protein IRY97_08545, partial [Thermomicrobiaceae bacterium]|nr:hypothetical protein [Thermomicrobiaceae bacterium]
MSLASRGVRAYLWVVGWVLLVEGVLSLLFLALGVDAADATDGVFLHDVLHCLIHIFWGSVMLAALLSRAPVGRLVALTLVFSVFYVLLALAGTFIHHPLGLYLESGENRFHTVVGLTGLALGLLALR